MNQETNLIVSDLITYWGAIVGSNSNGDLATWDGESNIIQFFDRNRGGTYDLSLPLEEDLAGRDLPYVMELVIAMFG